MTDRFEKYSGELSLLLWAVWNPIGFDVPLNEYEHYTPALWRMLEEQASVAAIAAELTRICEESITVSEGTDHTAAETLKRWWHWRFEFPKQFEDGSG
jgi:hypothetical protein